MANRAVTRVSFQLWTGFIALLTVFPTHVAAQRVSPVVAVRGTAPRGCRLINMSHASDVDPSLPTYVITHGWNPLPNRVRLTTPEAYAAKIRSRCKGKANVLAYQWDSRGQGSPKANVANAICAGKFLGRELIRLGVDPRRLHMIGHSMGSIVIASASNYIYAETGACTQCLTLIDGPVRKLSMILRNLDSTTCARRIINIWAVGLSGLGAPIDNPRIENIRAPTRRSHRRCRHWLDPARNNHVDVLLWYYERFL